MAKRKTRNGSGSIAERLSRLISPIIPASYGKVGDRWSMSAQSRDENHDRHDSELKAIYSVGSW